MMIPAAHRLDGIQEYYFATKLRQIAQMQAQGRPVINLGIGSPDLPPPEAARASLAQAALQEQGHGYQSYSGIPALRQAWADFYQQHYQATLQPEGGILPLIGSKEGILHIAMAFLNPGDQALAPNPGYPTYSAATRLAGATPLWYDLKEETGWQPDWAALEKTDLSAVKIMWLNYPHMPTGAPAQEGVFEKAVAFGKKHRILMVNDNPYSFILSTAPRSILAVPDSAPVALELNSLSKSHHMAGWRIGMVAGHPEYISTVLRFKSNMDSGQLLPLQQAAVAALRSDPAWYAQLNATYQQRQATARQLLEAIGCRAGQGQQGLFLWARIPEGFADGFALSDHLLEHAGVFLTPGGIFGNAGQAYIRISLCSPTAQLQQAMAQIERIFSTR